MTHNQIEYQKNQTELKKLEETGRSNRVNEMINLGNLNETATHNRATEQFNVLDLSERKRHNVATENQAVMDLAEKTRSNKANESNTALRNRQDYLVATEKNRIQEEYNDSAAQSNRLSALGTYERGSSAVTSASAALSQAQAAFTNAETNIRNADTREKEMWLKLATDILKLVKPDIDVSLIGGK